VKNEGVCVVVTTEEFLLEASLAWPYWNISLVYILYLLVLSSQKSMKNPNLEI
jgi:hypothetical protein